MNARGPERGRARRAALLGGIALVLGGVAATDMAGREQALAERVGEPVPVLVARGAVAAGAPLRDRDLAVRRVPERYAPRGALRAPRDVVGLEALTPIPAGSEILMAMVGDGDGQRGGPGAPVRPGERVADILATGSPELVQPGSRVDVVITRDERGGSAAGTLLALQDVEVLAAQAGPQPAGDEGTGAPRVLASLRVTLRQAVYLAAAQSFAREVRLLPRAVGDRRRADDALETGASLNAG
ncbi:MAG: Flp pilus assembly protein CpaB [Solirubrobacteraceae bacterium]|nr:Flp pilus assembly protein CpaB [Solirubrobacteraceae bacterium]